MLKCTQIKVEIKSGQSEAALEKTLHSAAMKAFGLRQGTDAEFKILKRSIDSRKKPQLFFVYTVALISAQLNGKVLTDAQVMKFAKSKNISFYRREYYQFPVRAQDGQIKDEDRPVIIGFGPAGMFAALNLAEAGFRPVVYERGKTAEERKADVERFWNSGELNPESNVQFGEGGAGTFSDGKLNTGIGDKNGRIDKVLADFVRFGAKEEILYDQKPHIGTDALIDIVTGIRNRIIELGGEVHFEKRLEHIEIRNSKIKALDFTDLKTGEQFKLSASRVILSVGHSARELFMDLNESNVLMQAKSFAVGLRVEHPQKVVDFNAYGRERDGLPTASYKVTAQTESGRGVYSFCMCPGGYVVNASSKAGHLAVNGMSYSDRAGVNANSAMIVTVTPKDFGEGVLDGMYFQEELERKAFECLQGKIPVQLVGDFKKNQVSIAAGSVTPQIKGKWGWANLREVLPESLSEAIIQALPIIDRHFHGFDRDDAVFSGVESRTSSPIRILRNENLESDIRGLFPCGEGAGYAGGITSAAVDGMKVAESVALDISSLN